MDLQRKIIVLLLYFIDSCMAAYILQYQGDHITKIKCWEVKVEMWSRGRTKLE